MTEISAGIAAQQAMLRQNVALSVIKQNANQEKQIANILQQAVEAVPAGSSRGTNVNITA